MKKVWANGEGRETFRLGNSLSLVVLKSQWVSQEAWVYFVPKVGHGEINPGGFLGNVRNQLDSCFGIGLFNKV